MNLPILRHPIMQKRGVALLVVLAFLMILFGLVTVFLLRTSIERQAAASFAASVSTAQLSDAAVNLVQGQIRSATTQGSTIAWASQPGMIRNFDTSGALTRAFKLYSASKLIYSGGDWAAELAGDVAPSTWTNDSSHWIDLNAPVMVPAPAGASPAQVARFPILDPAALGNVEGFAVSSTPAASAAHPMPMPVRWLYMLEDGTLTAPQPSTGATATIPGASSSNPIVGRVAFWTDDETCKLNINTSSDGTYWDVPRVLTKGDMAYGRFQPARNEFQRYPGHPAMTSLAPVFFASTVSGTTSTPDQLTVLQNDALFSIAPRIIGGGSNRGTAIPSGALIPDNDRLYASVDELYFKPERIKQLNPDPNNPIVTTEKLEYSKFFLTASSRAPETTLFDTPRVAMWPLDVQTGTDARSAYDRLLARCSTINDLPYYFTRSNPNSPTVDFPGSPTTTPQTGLGRNRNLYSYLQDLSARPIPGFGGSFLGKYGGARDGILTLMFDYIRTTNVDDSMLASTYRYSTRNVVGPTYRSIPNRSGFNQVVPISITTSGTTRGLGRFPVVTEAGIVFIACADGGDGSPGGVAGSNVEDNKTLDLVAPAPAPPAPKRTLLNAGERRIEALFFMEEFIPGQGWPPVKTNISTRVTGLDQFSVESTATGANFPLGFPSDGISTVMQSEGYGEKPWGGTISARVGLAGKRLPARGAMPADGFSGLWPPAEYHYSNYPFVSVPITVDTTNGTMIFSGGAITISLYPGRDATTSDTPVQTMTINFPAAEIPIPKLVTKGTHNGGYGNSQYRDTAKEDWWTFSYDGCLPGNAVSPNLPIIPNPRSVGRLSNWGGVGSDSDTPTTSFPGMFFRDDSDVVRSMVPAHSDFRLLGTKPDVVSNEFVPHPNYKSPTIRLAHSLVESGNSTSIGMNEPVGAEILLVTSATNYAAKVRPDVAIDHPNSVDNGDWDNGIGVSPDGPYANLPDGGNARGLYKENKEIVPYFATNMTGGYVQEEGLLYANDPAGDGSTSKPYYSLSPVFTFFSPNRQIPSAGMFGSLPTGMNPANPSLEQPYQTLLFRPQSSHPGAVAPKDHLWTDLFWMPVVEPYAISEPFSTAGKINLNYEILPFRHITRSTALVGLLRSERVPLIPLALAKTYKTVLSTNPPPDPSSPTRPLIDIPKTLAQFQTIFDANDIFRSASQICDLRLVPFGKDLAEVSNPTFWKTTYGLTGDNSRERPYTNLLGRLTTKSNTFTVHYRVQSLKQNPSSTPGTWNEQKDRVLAETRGATLIERYINPNDRAIPDYPTAANPESLGSFYKWRVVNTRIFAP